jgi:glycine oxidase
VTELPIAPNQTRPDDVLVLGAGLAGLTVGWELAAAGCRVRILDREAPGQATSRVAAGMLAPVTEAEPDDPQQLALGRAALARWPGYAAELEAASGIVVPLRRRPTLAVARDRDEAEALERFAGIRERLGLPVERLLPSAARTLEPALAPTLRGALAVPDEQAVDPRVVVRALAVAAGDAGARIATGPGSAVEELLHDGTRVTGARTADGLELRSEAVVIAAGSWSGRVPGLPGRDRLPVRPVKGQLLVLRDPQGPGMVERVLRFGAGYLVPRDDGRYVLGATTEERGFDHATTAWAVHDLLRDGAELVPGLLELELRETLAGLRPATPDGHPAIGPSPGLAGLWWATGHYRNGVLLAPLTGTLLADRMLGRPTDEALQAIVDPARPALTPTPEDARA